MKSKPLVLGITGAFGSGKSTVAEFFKSTGFEKITLSSFLEEEIKKRGNKKKVTRKMLQDMGNNLRKKFGAGILGKKASELLQEKLIKRAVIDGIRNVSEIDELKKDVNFTLISIISDRNVRFERLRKLKRREDLTKDLFEKLDRRDLGLRQKETGLHVATCIALADVFIDNNNSEEEFRKKLKKFLDKIEESL